MSVTETTLEPTRQSTLEAARLLAVDAFRSFDASTLGAFERLAAYAAGVVTADAAAVAFVDEAGVFLAGACGLARRLWAREGSFFDTVVRSGDCLLVADAEQDQRFCDHALVRSGMLAFAGVPIFDAQQQVLGALGALSERAGAFSATAVSDLASLARGVQHYLAERPHPSTVPETVQGWLGVRTVSSRGAGGPGLIVVSVATGSPAERADIRPADVLLALDETSLEDPDDIGSALAHRVEGTVARLSLQRGVERYERYVTIERRRATTYSRRRG